MKSELKKYCFDYIKENVMGWNPEIKKNLTKEMLYMTPWRVTLPYMMPDLYIPAMDAYGEIIDDIDDWHKQRDEYITNLYNELKGEICKIY
jgi:hypothetical protein